MRAVLDPNVLVSGVIGTGPPAAILASWKTGCFELVVSDLLLEELADVFARPKLAERVTPADASAFMELLRGAAVLMTDPPASRRSPDPDDDYLIALAEQAQALLVSGDGDLLDLAPALPVMSPRGFLTQLESG